MKFILHEIKLWFKENKTRTIHFLPNKVNVVTGNATTGKTSIWNIIDYCLLSDVVNIANTINEKVLWFGITFSINEKEMCIARKTPQKNVVSADIYFDNKLEFPINVSKNISVKELKLILDAEFHVTDNLRNYINLLYGKNTFNLSYRHFLLFNTITEDIIGTQHTYFDTNYFGNKKYDKALSLIFDLVIGLSDSEKLTAKNIASKIANEISKMQKKQKQKEINDLNTKELIHSLFIRLISLGVIDHDNKNISTEEALAQIQSVTYRYTNIPKNNTSIDELEDLRKKKAEIAVQINTLNKYKQECRQYVNSLNNYADSLKPIEFLKKNLSDDILYTSETQPFIQLLENSLQDIKNSVAKSKPSSIHVEDDIKNLQKELNKIQGKIIDIEKLEKIYQIKPEILIYLVEIKKEIEFFLKHKKEIPEIDSIKLNELITKQKNLEKMNQEIEQLRYILKEKLNSEIQQIYDQIITIPSYKGYKTLFDDEKMKLTLYPPSELFPLENLGSKSNYMFMHLCFYLGLHSHIINVEQTYSAKSRVLQFLFIDQPSIPYYSGNQSSIDNDDEEKLMNAFSIINNFISKMQDKKIDFQIIMTEHAPKSYWENNGLNNFYTVDEFINDNGLIPKNIFKNG